MATAIQRILRDRLNIVQDECEAWQEDHKLAIAYFETRDLVKEMIELFEAINQLDENDRLATLRSSSSIFNDGEMAEILYRQWHAVATRLRRLSFLFVKERFGGIEREAEFHSCVREAEGILSEDSKFFGDGLVELRDAAIDEHRQGDTVEFSDAAT